MKIFKHILAAIILIILSILNGIYFKPENPYMLIFFSVAILFLIFNLIIRKSLSYKNYFTSKYNLYTTNIRSQKSYDIPKELMFEKIIEVINKSSFKLAATDEDKLEILAITTITFNSWGENLYISFENDGDKTIMKFCSSTLFQIYSWGKNEKNYNYLVNAIEDSLIV